MSPFKNKKPLLIEKQLVRVCKSDLGRIQSCNLLSRNQVHYSVMLRGHF